MPRLKISLREMSNGQWQWQASDTNAHLGKFSTGEFILGGNIYGDGPNYTTACVAAIAAVEWWEREGKPYSLAQIAETDRKREQIKRYGKWFPIGKGPNGE